MALEDDKLLLWIAGGKSPSQRLRNAFLAKFDQLKPAGVDFDAYYNREMTRLIEQVVVEVVPTYVPKVYIKEPEATISFEATPLHPDLSYLGHGQRHRLKFFSDVIGAGLIRLAKAHPEELGYIVHDVKMERVK